MYKYIQVICVPPSFGAMHSHLVNLRERLRTALVSIKVLIPYFFFYLFLKSGVVALKPQISVVDKAVVARKGSTVNLTCSATRVRKLTTSSSWKFNGPEIKKRNNKIIIPEPHYQTNKRKGNFTLTIKNVSDTDVGTYTCKVSKIHLDTMLEVKKNIELSIQDEGEFQLQISVFLGTYCC